MPRGDPFWDLLFVESALYYILVLSNSRYKININRLLTGS